MRQTVLEQNRIADGAISRTNGAFGGKIGVIAKVFGCWHTHLSRPFTTGKQSYRACLNCGARRPFDAETLKTFGSFHYPPTVTPAANRRQGQSPS